MMISAPRHRDRCRRGPARSSSFPIALPSLEMRGAGPLAMGLATLAVYASTLFPSAAGGDASEFAFVACDASVPHPPGYPTFTMMAWLLSLIHI